MRSWLSIDVTGLRQSAFKNNVLALVSPTFYQVLLLSLLTTNCLSVFDHFLELVLKGLTSDIL